MALWYPVTYKQRGTPKVAKVGWVIVFVVFAVIMVLSGPHLSSKMDGKCTSVEETELFSPRAIEIIIVVFMGLVSLAIPCLVMMVNRNVEILSVFKKYINLQTQILLHNVGM